MLYWTFAVYDDTALPDSATGFVRAETVEHAFAMLPRDQTDRVRRSGRRDGL